MTSIRLAVLCCTVMVLTAAGASSAGAQTTLDNYLQSQNGQGSTIEVGETLQISLKPSNSGSSGYHWRVAKKPKGSVLRLLSNRTASGPARQVFTYRARGAGLTSLKLEYVAPGRGGRVTKTFRQKVLVNKPMPRLDCTGSNRRISLIAQTGSARVFKVRRTVRVLARAAGGRVVRQSYDVFLGCAFAEGRTHELGGYTAAGPDAAENTAFNVTLRGTVVGYVFDKGCPFEVQANSTCTSEPGTHVAAHDLNGGKLIRAIDVDLFAADAFNDVSGLVVSAAGGLAWTEVSHAGAKPSTAVLRSDAPAKPGQTVANDRETIASGADVDADSLYFDGTNVSWSQGGSVQRAPLR
jgi:hypothetical protein